MPCRTTVLQACLRVMMIAALPQWHHAEHLVPDADTTTIVSSVREGAAGIVTNAQGSHELHQQGEAHVIGSGGSNDGDRFRSSLLEKYTFRETIRTVIEEDQLPDLPEFLDSIGLGGKLEDFYRKSVFETKYFYTMNDMDLRLMGLSPEEMTAVKDKASELRVERDVTEERFHPLLARRNELTYGRLFLNRSASSFEFYLASFGPPAPVDEAMLVWAEPRNACGPLTGPDVSGAFVLAERGECSFVDKANGVARSNAAALVVINNGDNSEELFRVAATLGGRSGGAVEPKGPENMATVLVRGSALPSLSKALEWGPVKTRLVPLDCKPGRPACEAVLPEEQEAENQVESGMISVSSTITASTKTEEMSKNPEAFEFLSATFGATLPPGHVYVVPSVPEDACAPLDTRAVSAIDRSSAVGGAAVLVTRGGCSFGVKAKNVQDAGGRVMVVKDNGLGVLQNVGAPDPLAGELYIPGVFITARAGNALAAAAAAAQSEQGGQERQNGQDLDLAVSFTPDNSVARSWGALGATPWPTELLETRVLARQLKAAHADSRCRLQWINDKVRQAEGQEFPFAESPPDGSAASEALRRPHKAGVGGGGAGGMGTGSGKVKEL